MTCVVPRREFTPNLPYVSYLVLLSRVAYFPQYDRRLFTESRSRAVGDQSLSRRGHKILECRREIGKGYRVAKVRRGQYTAHRSQVNIFAEVSSLSSRGSRIESSLSVSVHSTFLSHPDPYSILLFFQNIRGLHHHPRRPAHILSYWSCTGPESWIGKDAKISPIESDHAVSRALGSIHASVVYQ
jgi:hypothetical protein